MREYRKLSILVILLLISLFLTGTPYVNLLFTGKIWVFYLLLLLYILFPKNIIYILYSTCILFLSLIVLTVLGLDQLAEAVGIAILALLWIIFSMRFYRFIKGS